MSYDVIVENIHKSYGRVHAVRGVSFKAPRGKVFGLLGPNGAGKTTTIKVLVGLVRPNKGKAIIKGHRAGSVEAKASIGYAPERFTIGGEWRLLDFLLYISRLQGLSKKVAIEKSLEVLEWVGLEEYEEERFSNLSAGMKRRFGLAQALVGDPPILILDEPTEHLDALGRLEFLNKIKELSSKGKTVLLSTHVLSEADYVVDSFVIMAKGRVIYQGSREELKKHGTVKVIVNKPFEFQRALIKANIEHHMTGNQFLVKTKDPEDEKRIVKLCLEKNIRILKYEIEAANISEVFLNVIKLGAEK